MESGLCPWLNAVTEQFNSVGELDQKWNSPGSTWSSREMPLLQDVASLAVTRCGAYFCKLSF